MKAPRLQVCFALFLLPTHILAAAPLTEIPGDAERGRAVFLDRDGGHCLLCHRADQVDDSFPGNLGPDLSDVGNRLSPGQQRERLIDPTRLNPETAMPAYHKTSDLRQVGRAYIGKPILTAQEIEDLVAFMITLTSQ